MKTKMIIGLAVGAGIVGMCGLGVAALSTATPQDDTPTAVQGQGTPRPTPAPNSIGEGLWKVGSDVKAGTYKTKGASDPDLPMCYWHTAKDDTDLNIQAQGLVDSLTAQGRVTLKNGQYFKTSGCQDWVKVTS